MIDGAAEIIIQGLTAAGERFRPSDWADRLCGRMSVFGEDRQLSYSPDLKPVIISGTTCVVVDRRLEGLDAAAYEFLMLFARGNELTMRPGRMVLRPEPQTAQFPQTCGTPRSCLAVLRSHKDAVPTPSP